MWIGSLMCSLAPCERPLRLRVALGISSEDAQFRAQLQIADTRVIRMEGTDVGLVTVRALDGKLLEVHTLCVQPARQGAGVGARIMQDVMIAARTAGSAVELSVLKSNSRAEHFYARLGFAKIGASTHHIRMRWPVAEED